MLVIIHGELHSIPRWAVLIQKDFTFMRRYEIGDETAYRKLECGAGWSGLISRKFFEDVSAGLYPNICKAGNKSRDGYTVL